LRQTNQIRELAIGSRHTSGQLTEPRECGVDETAFANFGIQLATLLWRLTRISRLEQRRISLPVKVGKSVQVALLNPPVEVVSRDSVGEGEHRMSRRQNLHWSGFVRDAGVALL